jgi:hypothetical protein
MRSSISASRKSSAMTYAKVLLAICLAVIAGLEMTSVYLLKHFSPTYQRISQQREEALKIRNSAPGEPASVLMVGNSLLLHGVKLDRLQAMTSQKMRVYPVFLEATGYYDWFYALRRLFREGARPDVVVVGVGVNYFLENGVRQDYAPMLFWDGRDTISVASDLHMDHTATTNLWLAHVSTFWDTRNAIRLQVLNHLVPHLEDLFSMAIPKPAIPDGPQLEEITIPRLQKLRELCEAHGAKLILLIPPTLSSVHAVDDMARAAQKVDVDTSVPIDPATVPARYYLPDGMHLNSDGAVMFTAALAKDLPERIGPLKNMVQREHVDLPERAGSMASEKVSREGKRAPGSL